MTKKNQVTEDLKKPKQPTTMDAAGGGHCSRNVLKTLVHRSGPELMHEISSKYDRNRTDYIEHATELAAFADEL